MFSRHARHAELVGSLRGLPPIEFRNVADSAGVKQRTIPEAGYEARPVLGAQPGERLDVQMVVMVMADEHEIDRRQVFEPQSGRSMPLRAGPGDRAGALGPDGIGEDVEAPGLNEHGGMIYKGDPQVFTTHPWWR